MYDEFEARREGRRQFLRRNLAWIVPLGVAVGVGMFFGIGTLVAWLWRATLVDIFAIKPISFWQAWGLLLLAQFLFKANMQPTTRTGRWRRRQVCRESSSTGPAQPLGDPEA